MSLEQLLDASSIQDKNTPITKEICNVFTSNLKKISPLRKTSYKIEVKFGQIVKKSSLKRVTLGTESKILPEKDTRFFKMQVDKELWTEIRRNLEALSEKDTAKYEVRREETRDLIYQNFGQNIRVSENLTDKDVKPRVSKKKQVRDILVSNPSSGYDFKFAIAEETLVLTDAGTVKESYEIDQIREKKRMIWKEKESLFDIKLTEVSDPSKPNSVKFELELEVDKNEVMTLIDNNDQASLEKLIVTVVDKPNWLNNAAATS
ncbi:mRNA-capping enzyme subunit beta [Candida viswanathii]|uniref:mRNA-capping enzyme subunit beta n=1 Tax=Candida viswanathii TaxID=5486 RepID=A0A367Y8K4_9ASCO|nr:mRNA-capping enzyme subunit beta [Candida viswanathii]